MKFEEKTTYRETLYQGKMIDLVLDDVLLPDGKAAKRELVKHPGAVAIIAFVEEDKMIFVRQFRKAIEKTIVEIPAGKIDLTDTDHLETAKRELEEETAYQAKNFYYDTSFYTSPGFADELLHVYVAEGLQRVAQPLAQDEDEFIELLEWDFDQAWTAYQKGEIIDAKTVYALMFWKLKREKK